MKSAKCISKFVVAGLSVLLLVLMFLPILEYKYYSEITKYYLYQGAVSGSVLLLIANFIYIPIALIFGTLILFSQFKNKDIMASALLLFACVCSIFMLLAMSNSVSASAPETMKKLAGFYIIFVAVCLQIAAVITYIVICLYKNYLETQNSGSSNDKETEKHLTDAKF